MLEIFLTDNARFTLQHIFDIIELKFGEKAAHDVLFEVEKTLNLVSKNPEIFKASSISKKIRASFISKQTSFYYQVNNPNLVVSYF